MLFIPTFSYIKPELFIFNKYNVNKLVKENSTRVLMVLTSPLQSFFMSLDPFKLPAPNPSGARECQVTTKTCRVYHSLNKCSLGVELNEAIVLFRVGL